MKNLPDNVLIYFLKLSILISFSPQTCIDLLLLITSLPELVSRTINSSFTVLVMYHEALVTSLQYVHAWKAPNVDYEKGVIHLIYGTNTSIRQTHTICFSKCLFYSPTASKMTKPLAEQRNKPVF